MLLDLTVSSINSPDRLKGFGFRLGSAVELFDDFADVGGGFRVSLIEWNWDGHWIWALIFIVRWTGGTPH